MVSVEEARVGDVDPWRQRVAVKGSGTFNGVYVVTPTEGKLQIYYFKTDGTQWWWNGTAYVNTETTLTTAITGDLSTYTYTHQEETLGRTVTFRGWIGAFGNPADMQTLDEASVKVKQENLRVSFR